MGWRSFALPRQKLCLDKTLRCGQSFRWKQSPPGVFSCALHGRLITLKQDDTHIYYRAHRPAPVVETPSPSEAKLELHDQEDPYSSAEESVSDHQEDIYHEALIRHYLNLGPSLSRLYEAWASRDPNFRRRARRFAGIRILQQDSWEALLGFICSSNNNIARISQMMDKLCASYGPFIGYIDGEPAYDIPPAAALTNPRVEEHLRELGFGYRAKYIHRTAILVAREADGWLDSLRNPEHPVFGVQPRSAGPWLAQGREGYRTAHAALLGLSGVGPKVADCVCLMGLGWGEAVPVDTHVWQIAQRDYGFGKGRHTSLTPATYAAIGDHFRQLWGKEAGWAHSVLFAADLRTFAEARQTTVIKTEQESITTITVQQRQSIVKGSDYAESDTDVKFEPSEEDSAAECALSLSKSCTSPPSTPQSRGIKREVESPDREMESGHRRVRPRLGKEKSAVKSKASKSRRLRVKKEKQDNVTTRALASQMAFGLRSRRVKMEGARSD